MDTDSAVVVPSQAGLRQLFEALQRREYRIVGPTVRDQVIVYDELDAVEELPAGWTDRQDAGSYRLQRREDEAVFGYNVGPHSWRKFLQPARLRLWRARRSDDGISVIEEPASAPKFALLGPRSCELHAMAIHDTVFLAGAHRNDDYALRREHAAIIAVNCGQAGGTCFCASMGTGPKLASGFDLALTELLDDGPHRFHVEAGTELGIELIAALDHERASAADTAATVAVAENASAQMGRTLETSGIKALLQDNPEHPRWDDVASRCLGCANCTLVCPTCFCTTVEDVTELDGDHAERWQRWDSCFSLGFSHIHGGSVRRSTKSRYRQWMTHKLAHWIDQFESSGCVGCGRCITWCPAGIDITEEVAAIRESGPAEGGAT